MYFAPAWCDEDGDAAIAHCAQEGRQTSSIGNLASTAKTYRDDACDVHAMPSTLVLDRDRVGPHEVVTARSLDGSINFLSVPAARVRVLLATPPGQRVTYGHVSYWAASTDIVDATTITFRINNVGTPGPTTMPAGPYQAEIAIGYWNAIGGPLRVEAAPTAPVALLGSRLTAGLRGLPAITGAALFGASSWRWPTWSAISASAATTILRAVGGLNSAPATIDARLRDIENRARSSRDAMLSDGGGGPPASVRPLIDGEANFAAIRDLISRAQHFVYITSLGFDEALSLHPNGPDMANDRIGHMLAERMRAFAGQLDVRILVYNYENVAGGLAATFGMGDHDGWLHPRYTMVRDLCAEQHTWGALRASVVDSNGRIIEAGMKALKQRAPGWIVDRVVNYYLNKRPEIPLQEVVLLPTGIQVARQNHPRSFGSHHQKMVITDAGTWIGGLNLQKQYWDRLAHLAIEPNRASSGEGSGPLVTMPWHDVGALVGGVLVQQLAMDTFATRWDQTCEIEGGFGPVVEQLDDAGHSQLADQLRGAPASLLPWPSPARKAPDASIFDRRVVRHENVNTDVDSGALVDRAAVGVQLPNGIGWARSADVTHTRDLYLGTIRRMDRLGAFVDLENQYASSPEIAEAIHERWRSNVGATGPGPTSGTVVPERLEEIPPFCFLTIPYLPQPDIDCTPSEGVSDLIDAEMRHLLWLEISAARRISIRDNGRWKYRYGVEHPEHQIDIVPPSAISRTTIVTVRDAIQLDDIGAPLVSEPRRTVRLPITDILVEGDVMTFTLVSNEERAGKPFDMSTFPGTPQERQHAFLLAHHVYVHAKCGTFVNDVGNTRRFVATIGSANLNRRSLATPDTESNIWFSGEAPVSRFRDELWQHALTEAGDQTLYARRGIENLTTLLAGAGMLRGHVLRLDLFARWTRLSPAANRNP